MRVNNSSGQINSLKTNEILNAPSFNNIQNSVASRFSNLVHDKVSVSFRKEIQSIVSNLDYYSDKIINNFSVNNLLLYKKYVKLFLRFIQKHSYLVRKIYGKNLDYKIINVVNEKLEEIANQIMTQEFSNLDLIDKLDEIRGLIIDLIS